MAAGGQGAPLVTRADWMLFTHPRRPRIIQNIGGIGNLTFLPPAARRERVIAFDTGPGNMVMDGLISILTRGRIRYDRGGAMAGKGRMSAALLTELMGHPFIRRRPPKTTGREEFGAPFAGEILAKARRLRLRDEDILATANEFTAASIAEAYRRFIFPKLRPAQRRHLQVILGGGGAKNPILRAALQRRIGIGEILTHEDFGIDNSAKEAMAFAILARETLAGRPGNLPSATGARSPAVLGKIIPGAQDLRD
jgi:anhydro-N-acetylmuramic acid kinase